MVDQITNAEFTFVIIVIGTILGLMILKVIFRGAPMPGRKSDESRR